MQLGPKLGANEFETSNGRRVVVPQEVTALDVGGYDVRIVIDQMDNSLRAREITITAREGSAPVDGAVLRRLRMGEVIKSATMALPFAPPKDEIVNVGTIHASYTPSKDVQKFESPTDDALKELSSLHRTASELGIPETQFVKKQMNLSNSHALYWIRLARKRGFLPPSKRNA